MRSLISFVGKQRPPDPELCAELHIVLTLRMNNAVHYNVTSVRITVVVTSGVTVLNSNGLPWEIVSGVLDRPFVVRQKIGYQILYSEL